MGVFPVLPQGGIQTSVSGAGNVGSSHWFLFGEKNHGYLSTDTAWSAKSFQYFQFILS